MLHKLTSETQKKECEAEIHFTSWKQMLQCKNKGLQTNFLYKPFGLTSKIDNLIK